MYKKKEFPKPRREYPFFDLVSKVTVKKKRGRLSSVVTSILERGNF